jgi:hypothetical protein
MVYLINYLMLLLLLLSEANANSGLSGGVVIGLITWMDTLLYIVR